MRVNVRQQGKYKILDVEGEINEADNYSVLKEIIDTALSNNEKFIALNLANTTFLNSGAVSLFISCQKKASAESGRIVIVEPPQTILEILRILGLEKIIKIYKNEDDFLRSVSRENGGKPVR